MSVGRSRVGSNAVDYMEQLDMNDELTFSHLITIDERARKLTIYRVYETGEKTLYTSVDIPDQVTGSNAQSTGEFARMLGENLLLDSPGARKLLGL